MATNLRPMAPELVVHQPRGTDRRVAGTNDPIATAGVDWWKGVPVLQSAHVRLRPMRLSDAPSLLALLSTKEVARFISPPPTTIEGFERFISWAEEQRAQGHYACFAVVPVGADHAVGIFQVRKLDATFHTAEWGFAIGSAYWGTGLFEACAALVLDFAFNTIGVHRLEARAMARNGRGNGALRKVGAVQEGVLRRSFLCQGKYEDQILWSILADEWRMGGFRNRTIH